MPGRPKGAPAPRIGVSPRRRGAEAGAAVLMALGATVAILVVGMGLLSAATQEYKSADRVKRETKALALAEAGVEWGVFQLSPERQGKDYVGSPSPVDLDGGTATCVVANGSGTDKIITGTGVYQGATVQVRVVARRVPFTFPNAALVAKGNIGFSGSHPRTTTWPNTDDLADIYANGSIVGSGTSTIDGRAYAVGSITGVSATAGLCPGSPPVTFPTAVQKAAWVAAWIANAQSGGTLTSLPDGAAVVGPKYIDCDVTGNHVFSGPPDSVIYIDGDWEVKNATVTSSCTIIVSGKILMGPNSDFRITGDPQTTVIASLSPATDAISLQGNGSSNPYGIVTALNGGIYMNGNTDFCGAFIADKDIRFTGGAQIFYPMDLTSSNQALEGDYQIVSYQQL